MNPAKLRLSSKEMELVTNADWILTKNGILQKARLLLEELCLVQEEIMRQHHELFPGEILKARAKISRGENYKGLPYLILDYPRCFDKENIFAIRTMFWWGHFFSTTLHLSGIYKSYFEPTMIRSFETVAAHEFYTCIHESAWEHDFEEGNYRFVSELSDAGWKKHITGKRFLKLAKKIPVAEWEHAQEFLAVVYMQFVELMGRDQLPRR